MPPEQAPFGSESRAAFALALFEARSSTYLKFVTAVEYQKAYMPLLDHFSRLAFKDYTGCPPELLMPFGPTGQGITGSAAKEGTPLDQ